MLAFGVVVAVGASLLASSLARAEGTLVHARQPRDPEVDSGNALGADAVHVQGEEDAASAGAAADAGDAGTEAVATGDASPMDCNEAAADASCPSVSASLGVHEARDASLPALGAATSEPPVVPPEEKPLHGLSQHPFLGQAYVTGGFVYGHSTNAAFAFDLAGLGVEAGASYLVGPHFPGPEGGAWSGLLLQPGLSAYAATELVRPVSAANLQAATMLSAGMFVGYQFLRLRPLGVERQSGFGFSAGYRVAYQYDIVVDTSGNTARSGDVSHGAVLSVSFPAYSLTHDSFGRALIDLEFDVLPDSDVALAKLTFGGGF